MGTLRIEDIAAKLGKNFAVEVGKSSGALVGSCGRLDLKGLGSTNCEAELGSTNIGELETGFVNVHIVASTPMVVEVIGTGSGKVVEADPFPDTNTVLVSVRVDISLSVVVEVRVVSRLVGAFEMLIDVFAASNLSTVFEGTKVWTTNGYSITVYIIGFWHVGSGSSR